LLQIIPFSGGNQVKKGLLLYCANSEALFSHVRGVSKRQLSRLVVTGRAVM
jgi:hypothetical protein